MENQYRQTKNGRWVIMGPSAVVKRGATVTVTKKSGSQKLEKIESTGKVFVVDGVECVYGYPAPKSDWARGGNRGTTQSSHDRAPGGRSCSYCGSRDCAKAWNSNDLCDEG